MSDTTTVGDIELARYPKLRSGKVREIFDLGEHLLFVATDRVSAFDVILPNLIPDKGRLLTQISQFWFDQTNGIVPNHLVTCSLDGLDLTSGERERLEGRSMVVRKAERIDVECVVRARLAGSGWAEYREHGTLAGQPLPDGLREGDSLPELRFTPATKNDAAHDENISIDQLASIVGAELAEELEETSKGLFGFAAVIAERAGFVLADSKFEFGHIDGRLTLIDEALTPDSSRYWNVEDIVPGKPPQGYDKQVIRNWLLQSGWDREPPAPVLPDDVVNLARQRYAEVLRRLRAAVETQGIQGV
jgi:phosphoribosylaminoimidazole-succinocarboxamide synthase